MILKNRRATSSQLTTDFNELGIIVSPSAIHQTFVRMNYVAIKTKNYQLHKQLDIIALSEVWNSNIDTYMSGAAERFEHWWG